MRFKLIDLILINREELIGNIEVGPS